MSALRGFPRALFSESELEGVRWFAHANGVPTLPSMKMIEREREDITRVAGAAPQTYTSKMGWVYAMATLAVMLAHMSMDTWKHSSGIQALTMSTGVRKPDCDGLSSNTARDGEHDIQ